MGFRCQNCKRCNLFLLEGGFFLGIIHSLHLLNKQNELICIERKKFLLKYFNPGLIYKFHFHILYFRLYIDYPPLTILTSFPSFRLSTCFKFYFIFLFFPPAYTLFSVFSPQYLTYFGFELESMCNLAPSMLFFYFLKSCYIL